MIDVILCLKNPDRELLQVVVQRIRAQPEVERLIFVVHNSIAETVLEFIESIPRAVWTPENISLAYARWVGIQQASSERISFVDHDTVIPEGFYTKANWVLDQDPTIGGVNGISVDRDSLRWGLKAKNPAVYTELVRGLCTANLFRRDLVLDWAPPLNLHAWEDFHLTHHMNKKGYRWLQIPLYVVHFSAGGDFVNRWLWVGAGLRMIQKMGLGGEVPRTYRADSHLRFFLGRVRQLLALPRFYLRYGANARAFVTEVRHQFCLLKGYLQSETYLQSRRGLN